MKNNGIKKIAISVIIPAYNEEKYIGNCLQSIRNQKFKDYELIVVDNNSTDNTSKIAVSFGARVVKEPKQGMTPARERGFREAKADIIARTDADTIVSPNWLKTINDTFKKHPEVIAMTGPWLSSNNIPHEITNSYSYFLSVTLGKLMSGHIFLAGPNMALRKSIWEKIKITHSDNKVHEDMDLACHLAPYGKMVFSKRMKIIFSYRKLGEDPIKGIKLYFGEYLVRYFKTLYLNDTKLFKPLKYLMKNVFN